MQENTLTPVDLSFFSLIAEAGIVVKLVMLLLFLLSVYSWAVIIYKWKFFKLAKRQIKIFEKHYRATSSLELLYNKYKSNLSNPMALMFVSAMRDIKDKHQQTGNIEEVKQRVFLTASRVRSRFFERMEDNLIVLATTASASPFIGLFGTVWGIVNSFQSIAASQNTTLAVVAPGIAEALIATGIGLFAAIPAAIFYNVFSSNIRQVDAKLDDFANEISEYLVH